MTREEAIRIIETVFQDEYVYKYYDSITHQALDMAIEALQTEAVQGWIPCSERLPSEGAVVLASWSCLWKGAIVLARRYEGKWEWAYEHGADYWQPTELEEYWPEAWMPLPEPYEPKTERRG